MTRTPIQMTLPTELPDSPKDLNCSHCVNRVIDNTTGKIFCGLPLTHPQNGKRIGIMQSVKPGLKFSPGDRIEKGIDDPENAIACYRISIVPIPNDDPHINPNSNIGILSLPNPIQKNLSENGIITVEDLVEELGNDRMNGIGHTKFPIIKLALAKQGFVTE